MMKQLQLSEGDPIRLTGARLPKGDFAKVQAQSSLFLELGDHKSVCVAPLASIGSCFLGSLWSAAIANSLEQALKNFTCLTKGDIIEIWHNMMTFEILIMELKPEDAPGVNLIDTDLSVRWSAPLRPRQSP